MSKAKASKKDITKEEAEKILKAAHDHSHDHPHDHSTNKKTTSSKKPVHVKKAKSKATKTKIVKKVSKK
jgi:trigger factor